MKAIITQKFQNSKKSSFQVWFCLIEIVYLKLILCLPKMGGETKDFIAACVFQKSWICDGLSCRRFSSQETKRTGMESTAVYFKDAPTSLTRNWDYRVQLIKSQRDFSIAISFALESLVYSADVITGITLKYYIGNESLNKNKITQWYWKLQTSLSINIYNFLW